jgi:streptomycin 6-kinase
MAKRDIVEVATEAFHVCDRHGLSLVRVIPNRSKAAFVAHARNEKGADILVKRGSGVNRTRRESKANQLWASVGAATFSTELEPGVMIREFSDGKTLKEMSCYGASYAKEVGALLAKMHSVRLSEAGSFLLARDYINERYRSQKNKLNFQGSHYRLFSEACGDLLYNIDFGNELAHGDFACGNIMISNERLFAFDARGFYGGGALDLVGYVMHIRDVDPIELLKEVLEGYGEAPEGLAATLAWRLVVSAQSGRYGSKHRDVTDRIIAAGGVSALEEMLRPRSYAPVVTPAFAYDHAPSPLKSFDHLGSLRSSAPSPLKRF